MRKIHVYLIMALLLMGVTSVWGAVLEEEIYFEKSHTLTYPATYTLDFSLWNALTGGTQTWSEEKSIALTDATIRTYLGDTVSLSPVDFSKQWWVRVRKKNTDGTYSVLGSRVRLNVVPYAVWTINGIPGPTGPQGPQGPQGPPGPANTVAVCVCSSEGITCSCNQTTVSKEWGRADLLYCLVTSDTGNCGCNRIGSYTTALNSCCVCR